jgi:hypothetical protein
MRYSIMRNLALILAAAFVVAAGCGPKSDRLPISGAVTLNGVPLDGGSIRFTSTAGPLSSTGAMIQSGEFQIPSDKGLRIGSYRVEISAPDNDAPPIVYRSDPTSAGVPTQPDRIPPEYNVDSKQVVEVVADGDNDFMFDIVSRSK